MKAIVCLILFISSKGVSQIVQFKLYGLNVCNGKFEKVKLFSLNKGNTIYYPNDTNGVCILPDTGHYVLHSDEIKEYYFNSFGYRSDTINLFSILECYSMHDFSGYCCCGEKCEGRGVDYYHNGQKRIEGRFRNGKPIGKVKYYTQDGVLKSIRFYNKKGSYRKEKVYKKN